MQQTRFYYDCDSTTGHAPIFHHTLVAMFLASAKSQRGKAWQSRNPNTSTTDFTDKKNPFPIREIREIRGKESSRK
jgi:hypothetical protein